MNPDDASSSSAEEEQVVLEASQTGLNSGGSRPSSRRVLGANRGDGDHEVENFGRPGSRRDGKKGRGSNEGEMLFEERDADGFRDFDNTGGGSSSALGNKGMQNERIQGNVEDIIHYRPKW